MLLFFVIVSLCAFCLLRSLFVFVFGVVCCCLFISLFLCIVCDSSLPLLFARLSFVFRVMVC